LYNLFLQKRCVDTYAFRGRIEVGVGVTSRPSRFKIGYDNERPKGDHRHRDDTEESYVFESPEKLIDDFLHEVDERRAGR
jgi:hypothetical protein